MYLFKITIGDWLGDGHGVAREFVVESNFPVDIVRKAHHRIRQTTGVDIDSICSSYEDTMVPPNAVKALEKLGFTFDTVDANGCAAVDEIIFANLWLFLLQKADHDLELSLVMGIPSLQHAVEDTDGRTIGNVGYGVFGR